MDVTFNEPDTSPTSEIDELKGKITPDEFRTWYRKRQYRENIENGQEYFNGPSSVPDAERHSPSQLLQCQRKIAYRKANAPEEEADPAGIYWFGTKFEEEIVVPFLKSVANAEAYVQNSIWVDFTTDTPAGEIRIKGSTDPVIVDSDAVPLLPTEIKSKSSVDHMDKPNDHHLAQLHAYLAGLNKKFDRQISEGMLVYGGRKSLDITTFHVEFDQDFWENAVLEWAGSQTQFRIDGELPPADPEFDWECQFCSYRNRCGKGEIEYSDAAPTGFLPRYVYPRSKVVEHLEAHAGVKLTPTLAHLFPELAADFEVHDWVCPACEGTWRWDELEPTDDDEDAPCCPDCLKRYVPVPMRGPIPSRQSECTSPEGESVQGGEEDE